MILETYTVKQTLAVFTYMLTFATCKIRGFIPQLKCKVYKNENVCLYPFVFIFSLQHINPRENHDY